MDSNKRTEVFATRLSEKEAELIKERAKQQGLSVSNLIRYRLFPSCERAESKRGKTVIPYD